MHTHAERPRRTGDVDRFVLATMAPAGVMTAEEVGKVRSGNRPRVFRKVRGA